jgi:ribosomal protein S18 acetylase RimI-like enzyme
MEIRPFRPGDQQAVIDLWKEIFNYPTPHNDPALVIRLKLQVQPDLFLVAIENQTVVGTVLGGYDGHRGWIYSLAVAPHSRRRGIATALVQGMEHLLRQLHCPKINLQVLAENAEVIAFYKHLGYAVEQRISLGKIL